MSDTYIGHAGSTLILFASNTLPVGLPLVDVSDDSDIFALAEDVIAEQVGTANGGTVSWSVSNPIEVTIGTVAGTPTDEGLNLIYSANKVQRGTKPARDKITISRILPNGETLTLVGGRMIAGTPAPTQQASGRLSSPSYRFSFSEIVRTPAIPQ